MNRPQHSLQEVHESVDTVSRKGGWKKLAAFLGPAYLVSVGYMDPGNWATDIAGGSQFGYTLIWVLVLSNLMALLLQSLSARLGVVAGLDLAQASRAHYPRAVNFFLWLLAEIAIAACDLAEVIGMAIGMQLLFGIPLLTGVLITVADTFLLLILQRFGIRKMEAFIIGLVSIIGLAFIAELFYAKPSMSGILHGMKPAIPNDAALYITIGIIGATVMPHNLYLHSSLVQTRKFERTPKGLWSAIRFNVIDSFIALNLALFVNAAILILAAAAFYENGMYTVESIGEAHKFLADILGTKLAPTLFAVALIAAGQSSTLTGTLSGQIVMEGYLNLRIQPWMRRLITRLLAIIPAVMTILVYGEGKTEDLLVLSQVILSLQLGFAVIPLIHFVGNKKLMGQFVAKPWVIILAWISATIIVGLNVKLVYATLEDWIRNSGHGTVIWLTVVPVTILTGLLLLWITFRPLFGKMLRSHTDPHAVPDKLNIRAGNPYRQIAVCVDFSESDSDAISHAIQQGGKEATYILIHITETATARVMNEESNDYETSFDEETLLEYQKKLEHEGYLVKTELGFGSPKDGIPKIVHESGADLLVIGAHGHHFLKDIFFGTTIDSVRHKVKVPLLVVRKK